MNSQNKKISSAVKISKKIGNLLLVLIILICIPLTLPKLFGYVPYTIVSGSMAPAIPIGSLVYVREAEPDTVEIGDVIAYYGGREGNAVVVHRVIGKDDRTFSTKGDANATGDLRPVGYEQLLGIVSGSIPKVGIAAQALTMGEGKILAIGVVALSLMLHLLAMILERKQEE